MGPEQRCPDQTPTTGITLPGLSTHGETNAPHAWTRRRTDLDPRAHRTRAGRSTPRTSPAEARNAFLEANAGTGFFINDHGNLTRVYGRAFSQGNSPVESAAAFVAQHASIWGADASQLLPIGPWGEGEHMIPLMWDAVTGTYDFSLVGYTQAVHGVPVFRSSLRLLVRNEAGFPLVLASSDLKDLGTFPETVKAFIAVGAPLDPSATRASCRSGSPRQRTMSLLNS